MKVDVEVIYQGDGPARLFDAYRMLAGFFLAEMQAETPKAGEGER